MFNISSFLKKTSTLVGNETERREKIITIIKGVTSIECTESMITIKNDTLIISGNPSLKNALFLKKEKLLSELSVLHILDIR